jgi:hypothetical protein
MPSGTRAPIQVYEVPSLQAQNIDGFMEVRLGVLRHLPVIVAIPREADRPMILFDESNGSRLKALQIGKMKRAGIDDLREAWSPISDEQGFCLGAHGSHSVVLFGIKPRKAGSDSK